MGAPWYRKPLCWTGNCHTFSAISDDVGCWGECSICGKRAGYLSRDDLRKYADAEAAARSIEHVASTVPTSPVGHTPAASVSPDTGSRDRPIEDRAVVTGGEG